MNERKWVIDEWMEINKKWINDEWTIKWYEWIKVNASMDKWTNEWKKWSKMNTWWMNELKENRMKENERMSEWKSMND